MLLGTIIKIICFYLPIAIAIKAFWLSRIKKAKLTINTSTDNLKINESFNSNHEDKNFWNQLKFQSKATEKTSSDEFANGIAGIGVINSESEEEKSPISKISFLSQNLQKKMKQPNIMKKN